MEISKPTLNALAKVITGGKPNEDFSKSPYRSGPELVVFFNDFGEDDHYGSGFPSRANYVEEKLKKYNNKEELKDIIEQSIHPINFIEVDNEADGVVYYINQFLKFDGYKLVKKGEAYRIIEHDEDDASIQTIPDIENVKKHLQKLNLPRGSKKVIEDRMVEVEKCIQNNIPLAACFLCGSTLEGILIEVAKNNGSDFANSKAAPKNSEGVLEFDKWSLNPLIETAYENGIIQKDVRDGLKHLRNYRNYIHPKQQEKEGFRPTKYTAEMNLKCLKISIKQISDYKQDNKN